MIEHAAAQKQPKVEAKKARARAAAACVILPFPCCFASCARLCDGAWPSGLVRRHAGCGQRRANGSEERHEDAAGACRARQALLCRLGSPCFASVKLTFALAAQMVLEKQLQDIIRYTNELENREATMYPAQSMFHR